MSKALNGITRVTDRILLGHRAKVTSCVHTDCFSLVTAEQSPGRLVQRQQDVLHAGIGGQELLRGGTFERRDQVLDVLCVGPPAADGGPDREFVRNSSRPITSAPALPPHSTSIDNLV
jgi:hypothetical protein